jgi:hypothetical protein
VIKKKLSGKYEILKHEPRIIVDVKVDITNLEVVDTEKDKRKEHISTKENEAQQGCPAFQSGVGRPGL